MSEQTDPTGTSLGVAFGHLALKRGLITPEQLREALIEQSKSSLQPLDAILLERGYLTRSQVEQLRALRESTTFPIEAPVETPAKIGKYALVREIGRGAMARVYEAKDADLQRRVALKVLHASAHAHPEEARIEEERFLREARLLASLPKHPSIVGIYDAGVAEGRRYLAMEYIDGLPMDQWFKKGSTTLGRPTALLRDVALAVHDAHRHGVIHRDLKPANILVDPEGHPHVMDFGLAKLVGQDLRASYTEGALAVGTPAYMSPEQASGVKSVDPRTDVYAMGVMLYEILTGRLPFTGGTPQEVMIKASKDPVVPPSKITGIVINPERFKRLEAVCLKALAKNPADRYDSAQSFAEDLTRWLRGRKFRVRGGRFGTRVLAAGALILLLGIGGVAMLLKPSPAASAPAPAPVPAPIAVVPPQAPAKSDPWASAIDLLARVELPRDVVSGEWDRDGAVLISRNGKPARISIPYRAPEEYDLRAVFSRRPANFCVNFILTRDGGPFTLVAHNQGYFGFERVGGLDFNKNPSTARYDPLQIGRSYTLLVELRKSSARTYLDGHPLSRLDSFDGVAMNPDWKLPDADLLGVGTWDGGAVIEKLELREVSGKGEFLRPLRK